MSHTPTLQDWILAILWDQREQRNLMNAQQTQIDALKTEVDQVNTKLASVSGDVTTISTGVTGLQASVADLKQQIIDLQAANPALDLSGLQTSADSALAAVGQVLTAADSVNAALNPPPAPPLGG